MGIRDKQKYIFINEECYKCKYYIAKDGCKGMKSTIPCNAFVKSKWRGDLKNGNK